MDDQTVSVKEDNEHLGLIVSNTLEEQKNVDIKLKKCRGALFKLLGPTFSSKCLISPALKTQLFRTYIAPIARSGLSALTLSAHHINPLTVFHRKSIRGFLGLSNRAPVPSLYFLTGELPLEASIHRDIFSLFHNLWSNPTTKIHGLIKYLLENCPKNSNTWSRHIRNLALTYSIQDPNEVINNTPPSKREYSNYILTKITVYWEKELRERASKHSNMKFLNVNLKGLNGRPHPCLKFIRTTRDARKARSHLKFLCSDIYTFEKKGKYQGGSSKCRLCLNENENIVHIISICPTYSEIRTRILEEMKAICETVITFDDILSDNEMKTQFILDCTSPNLACRISPDSDIYQSVLKLSRDLCFGILKHRTEQLKILNL